MLQDKLGMYRVGDLKCYSKLQAIELHTKTKIHPHWDFNESVFDCYNWKQEPSTGLKELYRQRSQQLRDKYDYLILMFSGGADSTNVLYSFLENDIKIDELCTFINYDGSADKDSFCNAEVWRVVFPLIDELKQKYPWLQHHVIDLTTPMLEYFADPNNKFEWVYDLNSTFNPNTASRQSLPLKVPKWRKIIDQGQSLCMIYAVDKPRLIHHPDGRYSFRMIDIIDTGPTVRSIAGLQPYTDELFYWTPDLPELLIKQAHIIKNYLSQENVQYKQFMSTERSDLAFRKIDNTTWWLSNHGVHQLVYPYWDINTFSRGKVASAIFSDRDFWFFDLEAQSQYRLHWHAGLQHLWQSVPDYWKNDPKDISKGLRNCWSKDYFLS